MAIKGNSRQVQETPEARTRSITLELPKDEPYTININREIVIIDGDGKIKGYEKSNVDKIQRVLPRDHADILTFEDGTTKTLGDFAKAIAKYCDDLAVQAGEIV